MQKFLNTLWEFTGVKNDKGNFIQKALKVCKVFKVKPLKTPKLDVPSKKTAYNLFCKDVRKTTKELLGVPVSKASVIISKEWKKIKANKKQMKNYKDLYEEEEQRHEEALQRYQEDHADEMEIINLYKKCSQKERKEPKKASDYSSEEEQKSKKTEKRPPQNSLKKYQKPLSLLIQAQMTQTMNKNLSQNSLKKHQKPQSLLTMNKGPG